MTTSLTSLPIAFAALIAAAGPLSAQSASSGPVPGEFDVATIKPTAPGAAGRWIRFLPRVLARRNRFGGALGNGAADSPQPNLYAAIQSQLGLGLEITTGTVDTLVIDRVQRPTQN